MAGGVVGGAGRAAGAGPAKHPEVAAMEKALAAVQDRIAGRELDRIGKRKEDAEDAAWEALGGGPFGRPARVKQERGHGLAPGDEEAEQKEWDAMAGGPLDKKKDRGAFSDPAAFAKQIQEGLFGKDKVASEQLGVQKQTLENVKEMVAAFKQKHRGFGLVAE
jgi:hypothetical protein